MDEAWRKVIDDLGLDLAGSLSPFISSSVFAKSSGIGIAEACRIDSSRDLPSILKNNGLFPLPIREGSCVLVKGQGFHEFEPIATPAKLFESELDHGLVDTKGRVGLSVLHHMYDTGLLSTIMGTDGLWMADITSLDANEFSFMVGSTGPVYQRGVRIYMDGLFESRDSVVVARTRGLGYGDFPIHWLYYPYRHWRTLCKKDVRSLFVDIEPRTDTYGFWQYRFVRANDFSSIELESCGRFKIKGRANDGKELDRIPPDPMRMEIPQADDLEKVCLIPQLVAEGLNTSEMLAKRMGFTARQALYYAAAAEQLGLVERYKGRGMSMMVRLTGIGAAIIGSRPDRRHSVMAEQMMRLPIVRVVFDELMEGYENGAVRGLSREDVADIIHRNSGLNKITSYRRAGTIFTWFSWLSIHYGAIRLEEGILTICMPP